jgi:hypothetical protein
LSDDAPGSPGVVIVDVEDDGHADDASSALVERENALEVMRGSCAAIGVGLPHVLVIVAASDGTASRPLYVGVGT